MSDRTGVWFAMAHRARLPPLDDVAAAFAKLRNATVRKVDDHTLVVTVFDTLTQHTVDITAGLSTEPHVILEAAEIAEEHGADRPDRDDLATRDARFELVWKLEEGDETYNPMLIMSEILEDLCGAVVFDVTVGRFV